MPQPSPRWGKPKSSPPAGGIEGGYLFRASGSSLRFKGFLAVYEESKDEDEQAEEYEVDRRTGQRDP